MDVRFPVEQEAESVYALSFVSVSPQGLARVQQATKADGEMVFLKTALETGWPGPKGEAPLRIQSCFHFRNEVSVLDGLVLRSERLFVP